MTPESVARIVQSRDEAAFIDLVRAADAEFVDAAFEAALADALRAEPTLIELWVRWSGDQRWAPGAYLEGVETGWFDGDRQHVRTHLDSAAAVADFVRRTAAWVARRDVIIIGQ